MANRILTKAEKLKQEALAFALISVVVAVFTGAGMITSIPPSTWIFLGFFLALWLLALVWTIRVARTQGLRMARAAIIVVALSALIFGAMAANGFSTIPAKRALIGIEVAVRPACAGQAVPGTAAYSAGSGAHRLVADFTAEEAANPTSSVSQTWLSETYLPETLDQVDLVVCAGEFYTSSIETCGYNDGTKKQRLLTFLDVRLVAARTGQVVAEGTLQGGDPKACPRSTEQGNDSPIKGSKPSRQELEAWLEKALTP